MRGGKPLKVSELNQIKEVGKKTIADFVRSETGSVGVKNAAAIAAFAAALALGQATSEAATWTTTVTIGGVTISGEVTAI